MKASNVFATKAAKKEKPDLEEAMDESDDGDAVEEIKVDDDATDLAKDKYVKQPKKKAAPRKAAAKPQKGKGKKKAADDDDDDNIDDESEEEVKPKPKGRGKAAAGAKGKKK
jgi:replication factor C subunit 1